MLNNYFTLKSQADYLNSILPGCEITGIFTHAKNKIIISLRNKDGFDNFLFISLEKNHETLFLEDNFGIPKSNVLYFFENISGRKITGLGVPEFERIVRIELDNGCRLVFTAIPGRSNLFLVKDNLIAGSFRDKEKYVSHSVEDIFGSASRSISFSGIKDLQDFRKKLSFFGKYYLNDFLGGLKQKNLSVNDLSENAVRDYVDSLYNSGEYLLYSSGEDTFCSLKSLIIPDAEITRCADSNSMVRNCYFISLSASRKSSARKNLLEDVENKISRLERKIGNLKNNLDNSDESEKFKHYGDLILSNIHVIGKGDKYAEIDDYISGSKLRIKLKENLTPSGNADYYYSKYKGWKNSVEILKEKIGKYEMELSKLFSEKEVILKEENAKNLIKMEKRTDSEQNEETLPFRVFRLSDKFEVWVGKSSASNDLLTMKYARQYDLWFHVRGSSGSHTVLRFHDKNDMPDKELIRKAASIAAYYSKARKGRNVPVAYCERKYVKKRKGMNEGAVIMEKEKVVFVDPVLPE